MGQFRVHVFVLFAFCLLLSSPLEANCSRMFSDTLRSKEYLKGVDLYNAGDYSKAVKNWKRLLRMVMHRLSAI